MNQWPMKEVIGATPYDTFGHEKGKKGAVLREKERERERERQADRDKFK